jgi:predicted metalloprotease
VIPDSFTHAASAQRQLWFMTGLKEGTGLKDLTARNIFQGDSVSGRPAGAIRSYEFNP